jgi:ABC-type transport system substrate-binding protein
MEAVQGYLMAVGINVETLSTELGTALPDYYFVGANDMAILMANGANNSRDAWQVLSATYNVLFIDRHIYDEEYIALCDDSLASTDQAERDAAYAAIDDWLYDNYMLIPYCEIMEAWCYNSRIASLDMLNVGYSSLGNIKLA